MIGALLKKRREPEDLRPQLEDALGQARKTREECRRLEVELLDLRGRLARECENSNRLRRELDRWGALFSRSVVVVEKRFQAIRLLAGQRPERLMAEATVELRQQLAERIRERAVELAERASVVNRHLDYSQEFVVSLVLLATGVKP